MNLPITQTTIEDLKIFFFVVRPVDTTSAVLNVQEEGFSALAFNLEGAQQQFFNKYQGKEAMNAKSLGSVLVKDIQDLLESPLLAPDKADRPKADPMMTRDQFLNNMKFVADEYLEDEKDVKALEKLIKKLTGEITPA